MNQIPLLTCPHCKNERQSMFEPVTVFLYYCEVCSKIFRAPREYLDAKEEEVKRILKHG